MLQQKFLVPLLSILPIEDLPAIIYWPLRLLIIFPVYQVLLVLFGFIFGAIVSVFTFKKDKFIFNFFFNLSLKMSKKNDKLAFFRNFIQKLV